MVRNLRLVCSPFFLLFLSLYPFHDTLAQPEAFGAKEIKSCPAGTTLYEYNAEDSDGDKLFAAVPSVKCYRSSGHPVFKCMAQVCIKPNFTAKDKFPFVSPAWKNNHVFMRYENDASIFDCHELPKIPTTSIEKKQNAFFSKPVLTAAIDEDGDGFYTQNPKFNSRVIPLMQFNGLGAANWTCRKNLSRPNLYRDALPKLKATVGLAPTPTNKLNYEDCDDNPADDDAATNDYASRIFAPFNFPWVDQDGDGLFSKNKTPANCVLPGTPKAERLRTELSLPEELLDPDDSLKEEVLVHRQCSDVLEVLKDYNKTWIDPEYQSKYKFDGTIPLTCGTENRSVVEEDFVSNYVFPALMDEALKISTRYSSPEGGGRFEAPDEKYSAIDKLYEEHLMFMGLDAPVKSAKQNSGSEARLQKSSLKSFFLALVPEAQAATADSYPECPVKMTVKKGDFKTALINFFRSLIGLNRNYSYKVSKTNAATGTLAGAALTYFVPGTQFVQPTVKIAGYILYRKTGGQMGFFEYVRGFHYKSERIPCKNKAPKGGGGGGEPTEEDPNGDDEELWEEFKYNFRPVFDPNTEEQTGCSYVLEYRSNRRIRPGYPQTVELSFGQGTEYQGRFLVCEEPRKAEN